MANVIWCTGFRPGLEWIDLPVFGSGGLPRHRRGVAVDMPGLAFVGLPFLYAASSTMVHGVPRDAAHVVAALADGTTPLVFAGVALLTGVGRPDAYGEEPVSGVLFGPGNAIVYATFLLAFRPALRGLANPTGPLLDATLGATAATFVLGVTIDPAFDLMPSWPGHGRLLLLAVGPQVVGWWVIIRVLPRLPALDTSLLLLVQPMFTAVRARPARDPGRTGDVRRRGRRRGRRRLRHRRTRAGP